MTEWMTGCAAETRKAGECLASRLQAGDVLALYGDMGAGKSELTRGIARGLGVEGHIVSPTFTVLQAYESGRLPLYHFDWYRLSGPEELYELTMEEYLYGQGVAVVEWPQQAAEALPETHLKVTLTPLGENRRRIALEPMGGFRTLEGM